MELVRGVPITQFCDQHKLTTRERLELFLQVCGAVQHAHMKGIIHRDLKPSNVIVELHDVKPVPKVIDFGVAKATGERLTQHTLYTQFSQLVGTPLYMSPEQAKQSALDIDTRSDIYSLGVLLYELLTGTTPFDKQTLSSVNITELQRIICEDEPPRPSLRISTLKNEQLSTISTSRKTEPRQLGLSMQRELDWIVMKALEKDRTRRYESASAFAADIQRYLDDEPVLACPPSVGYRLRKLARKHKGLLTTAAIVVLMLLASTIVSGLFAIQADQARDEAENSEQNAKDAEAAALTQAALAISEAERADKAATQALIAQEREALERHRAESALYVADTRLAAANIEDGAHAPALTSLMRHYSSDSEPDSRGWEWYYLLDGAEQSLLTWQAGSWNVPDIDWSPDGTRIASVHWDGSGARIWNAETGELLQSFSEGRTLKMGIDWSPSGAQLAWGCVSDENLLRIWDAETDEVVELFTESGSHRGIEWSPDGKRIAVQTIWDPDGPSKLMIWEKVNGQWTMSVSRACQGTSDHPLAWNFDGTMLATAERHHVLVNDPSTLDPIFEVTTAGDQCCDWFPTENIVAIGTRHECIIFDAEIQEERARFEVGPVAVLKLSPDGRFLATAGDDGLVKVWNTEGWSLVSSYGGHDGAVSSITWHPGSSKLASCGTDGQINIWPVVQESNQRCVQHIDSNSPFVWTANGYIRTCTNDTRVIDFHPRSGNVVQETEIDEPGDWRLLGSNVLHRTLPDEVVMTVDPDGPGVMRRLNDIRNVYGRAEGSEFVFIPQGFQSFAIPTLVDIVSATEFELGESGLRITEFRWSPDGETIAGIGLGRNGDDGSVQFAGWIHLFDRRTGQAIDRARVGVNRVGASSGSWSRDSTAIAVGTADGICEVFDAKTLRKSVSRRIHRGQVTGISWHPEQARVASASEDETVAIWDAKSGEVLLMFDVGQAANQIEWSPDGQMLAARFDDGEYYVWDAQGGYQLANSEQFQTRYNDRLESQYHSLLVAQDFANARRIGMELLDRRAGNSFRTYYTVALLSASNKDSVEYSQVCRQMVTQFRRSSVVDETQFTAWTCALAPDAVDDYEVPLKLAESAVEREPENQQYLNSLGAIQLRAGLPEAALATFDKAAAVNESENTSSAYDYYFRALAEHALERTDAARQSLAKANELAAAELENETDPPAWNRELTLELLRKEGEGLIGPVKEAGDDAN